MTNCKLRNKWSIKAVYYSEHNRQRYLDGPWKETVKEAVKSFAEYLDKKGLLEVLVFKPFLAERCKEDNCQAIDSKGNPYRDLRSFNALVSRGLIEYFTRCPCEHPCYCSNNGYRITQKGMKVLAN